MGPAKQLQRWTAKVQTLKVVGMFLDKGMNTMPHILCEGPQHWHHLLSSSKPHMKLSTTQTLLSKTFFPPLSPKPIAFLLLLLSSSQQL
jgi:uncharacterized membrane protein